MPSTVSLPELLALGLGLLGIGGALSRLRWAIRRRALQRASGENGARKHVVRSILIESIAFFGDVFILVVMVGARMSYPDPEASWGYRIVAWGFVVLLAWLLGWAAWQRWDRQALLRKVR